MIITHEHFDEVETQPRFIIFLLANGYEVGDRMETWEFQLWISD
nr:hypothetical protein [Heyndrickxia oleronia]